ncbi:early nodulin-20-like isoform X3 [Cervus elaphus]|uniref:early nodulin-20-like isoform X3 n=1 Tax=Cervus elaphus TaxID=9860 RepID=UPI001CC2FBFE|nr:early nodulin-20-like isoform X3 [Cervus elaphus]
MLRNPQKSRRKAICANSLSGQVAVILFTYRWRRPQPRGSRLLPFPGRAGAPGPGSPRRPPTAAAGTRAREVRGRPHVAPARIPTPRRPERRPHGGAAARSRGGRGPGMEDPADARSPRESPGAGRSSPRHPPPETWNADSRGGAHGQDLQEICNRYARRRLWSGHFEKYLEMPLIKHLIVDFSRLHGNRRM